MKAKQMTEFNQISDVLKLIRQERERQIKKGFDYQHDDNEINEELARAASVYAMPQDLRQFDFFDFSKPQHRILNIQKKIWPYKEAFNPSSDRVKELIKAAALIVAEIERIERFKK
jgi:hypothetical protein